MGAWALVSCGLFLAVHVRDLASSPGALELGMWNRGGGNVRRWPVRSSSRSSSSSSSSSAEEEEEDDLQLFRELRMCETFWFHCEGDPACDGDSCRHVRVQQETFHKARRAWHNFSVDFTAANRMTRAFFQQRKERRKWMLGELRARVPELLVEERPWVLLMVFNFGYAYQFLNWYCSVLASDGAPERVRELKRHLIVFTTDRATEQLLGSMGVVTLDARQFEWVEGMDRIGAQAAQAFGFGHFQLLQSIAKLGVVNDFVSMGFDTVVMDSDVVWTGNAVERMKALCGDDDGCDGVFMRDGLDRQFFGNVVDAGCNPNGHECNRVKQFTGGELMRYDPMYETRNCGLFMLRANPSTVRFVNTLMHGLKLQLSPEKDDQILYNTMMFRKAFSGLDLRLLPWKEFYPGGMLHKFVFRDRPAPSKAEGLVAVHASDATNHLLKVRKLFRIGHWYLSPERCPAMFGLCHDHACFPKDLANYTTMTHW